MQCRSSHIVGGGGGHEDDGGDVVEALNPLPPLVALPAHVKHVELDLVHPKLGKGESGLKISGREKHICYEMAGCLGAFSCRHHRFVGYLSFKYA